MGSGGEFAQCPQRTDRGQHGNGMVTREPGDVAVISEVFRIGFGRRVTSTPNGRLSSAPSGTMKICFAPSSSGSAGARMIFWYSA